MKSTEESGIIYSRWGGTEVLEYTSLPERISHNPDTVKLKSDELLIRVKSISVNPIDWKIMSGSQRLVTGGRFPRIFGTDFSGVVVKSGRKVREFEEGDLLMGMISPLKNGTGRQFLKVKARHCIKIPGFLSFHEAASLPEACISAVAATNFSAKREPGRVLVIGAGGGVGSIAVQILSSRNWHVSAVCRKDQQAVLTGFGCRTFYDRDSWRDKLNSSDEKWDAVIDGPAAIIEDRPARFLKRGGCYSPVFIPDSFIPFQILRKVLWSLRPFSTTILLGYPSRSRMMVVENLINNGMVKPLIDSVWKAEDCGEAVGKSAIGGVTGKIIINLPDGVED